MLQLREMEEAEFAEYKLFVIDDFARDLSRYYDMTAESARAKSTSSIESRLSQGLATPNQILYIILRSEDASESQLGYLWIEVEEIARRCFIYDIYLHEAHRGQGWGRKTLELLETEMKVRGVHQIGLSVFYENSVARELYTRMGYQIVSMNMQKKLGTN